MKSIYELIDERFGVRTRVGEDGDIATITTTNQVLLRANPSRYGFIIVNLGANPVFIRPNAPASSTVGIRIDPNGGSAAFSMDEDFSLPAMQWQAITSGGDSAIFLISIIGEP